MSAPRSLIGGVLALACAFAGAESSRPETVLATSGIAAPAAAPFVIYCDFQCPFCGRLFTALLAGATAEGREVRFHFRHYPFHGGSNQLARFYEAAVVNHPDQRTPLIDSLYKFRQKIRDEKFDKVVFALGILHGLDARRIQRDMEARDVLHAVSKSKRAAVALGVDATPTVFHGGIRVDEGEPEEIARYILDHSGLRDRKAMPVGADECTSCQEPGIDQ